MNTNTNTNTAAVTTAPTAPTAPAAPRNRAERRKQQPESKAHARPESAESFAASPPPGWKLEVVELGPPTSARKRLRALVMEGEHGFRVLPFMTVRVLRRTLTDAGEVEVEADLDILPHDPLARGLEAGLFTPDAVAALAAELSDCCAKQQEVRHHSRELVQRPFAAAAPLLKAAIAAPAAPKPAAPKPVKAPVMRSPEDPIWYWVSAIAR
jgi:hypothetical protein